MNIAKKIYPKEVLSALDVGKDYVTVLIARRRGSQFEVLGGGQAPARGFKAGEIIHLGDAADALALALSKAEESSGAKTENLFLNFNDVEAMSKRLRGTRFLTGEGQIGRADVDLASSCAKRLGEDFSYSLMYEAPVDYWVDDKDHVEDPLGVFGAKLDVDLFTVFVRSSSLDQWKKVLRRTRQKNYYFFLSILSSFYGVVQDFEKKGVKLLADVGADLCTLGVFDAGRLVEFGSHVTDERGSSGLDGFLAEGTEQAAQKYPDLTELILTGDLATADLAGRLTNEHTRPMTIRVAESGLLSKFSEPRFASLAGILVLADEMKKKTPELRDHRSLWANAKIRFLTFLEDYF